MAISSMKKRKLVLLVTTPISDYHWLKLTQSIRAVSEIGTVPEYVELISYPWECHDCLEDTCEGCSSYEHFRKMNE